MFISEAEYSAYFGKAPDAEIFYSAELAAAQIIRDKCGIENPANASDAPKWVKYPAAAITNKIIISRNNNVSPEKITAINENYKQAILILNDHIAKAPKAKIKFVESEDTYTW